MNNNYTTSASAYLDGLRMGFEKQSKHVEKVYKLLPVEELQKPSTSGGWSIAQCLDHLNSYYRHYLPRMEKQVELSPDQPLDVFRPGWLGKYVYNTIDPDNTPKKYKAMAKHQPVAILDPCQVVAEFIAHSRNMDLLMEKSVTKNLNKIRIQTSIHPLVSIRLGDTFRFLLLHNERHIRQAERNIQAAD